MLSNTSLNKTFSHIYVEENAYSFPMTQEILSKFPDSIIINIRHYKDVFNRPGQDSYIQNMSKSLILAVNTGNKIFEASPVCQNFGFGKFYYCESAMNCVFSCDYCFLKGMYKTSNVVVFVNYEDYLEECKSYLKTGPMYLCASFDTDLSAISNLCNWQKIWEDFAATNENLTIELRTKAALKNFRSLKNIIYAFTISPQDIIDLYEKKTPSLKNRLESVSVAINLGAQVRLCFDPMIYIKNYNRIYSEMMDIVESSIDLSKVRDFGVGTFRISADYLNNLRKSSPQSSAVLYPFCKENGYCVYPESTRSELTSVIVNRLERAGVGSKVFINE